MKNIILSLAWASLLVAACSSDVEVGGPRESGGDESATGGQGEASSDASDEKPTDPATFAAGESPCTTAADCCVVINDCSNTAYVVGIDDQAAATEAAAAEKAGQEAIGRCTACIAPMVEVSCVDNKCVGVEVDITQPNLDQRLAQDHCGSLIEQPETATDFAAQFGCGVH